MTQLIQDYCLARAREMNDNGLQINDMVALITNQAAAKFSTTRNIAQKRASNAVAEIVSLSVQGYIDIGQSNSHLVSVIIDGKSYGITLSELADYIKTRSDL